MRPDLSTAVQADEPAEFPRASTAHGDIPQRLLTQVVVGRRCQRAIQAVLEELQLTDTQLLVLWGIEQHFPSSAGSGVGQSEVAQSLGISPAQVSGLVEQLRQQEDLDCRRAPHDRRQQLWHLTESGRQRLQQALSRIANLDASLLVWPEATLAFPSVSANEAQQTNPAITVKSLQPGEAA